MKTEWSGPAWYKVKHNKDGFPVKWNLAHFVAADLGHGTSTEYKAKDIAKIAIRTLKNNPKLKDKDMYMGMIHSHHTMGAYHSGTDEDTLEEMVPNEGFFGSLVVSSTAGKEHAFAFSYRDQYKNITMREVEDVEITAVHSDEFKEEADHIEKISKMKAKATIGVTKNGQYQYNLGYATGGYPNGPLTKSSVIDATKKSPPTTTLKNLPNPTEWEKYQAMEEIIDSLEDGSLNYVQAAAEFKQEFGIAITDYYDITYNGDLSLG